MTTYASFKYPKKIYTLPGSIAALRKKWKNRFTGQYYSNAPRPISGTHPSGSFYLDSDFMPGRYWKWANDVCRSIGHTGWYTDEDGISETIRGIVIYLPHGRFLAGWSMGEGMASEYDGEFYTDEDDAARAADELARVAAEAECEYQEEQRRIEEEEEENMGGDEEEDF